MPLPTPVLVNAANPVVQIVEVHSVGDNGWSEVYHLYCPGAGDPLAVALERHQTIVNARVLASPVGHVMEAMRVSDVSVFGDSKLKFPPEYHLGAGSLVQDTVNPAMGYLMNVSDITGTISETRIYRGWGVDQQAWNQDAPRATIAPPGVRTCLQIIGNELNATRTVLTIQTQYVTRSFLRPGTVGGPDLRLGMRVTVNASNSLQFITSSPVPTGWEPGARIKVRANRVRCVRGISGTHMIASVDVVGAVATVVTNTAYNCDPAGLGSVVASGYLETVAYYPIRVISIGGAAKRDTGRPFFVTRGRQRSRA